MASLFISYSRKDINFARQLTESFKGQNLDFWIDWEGIPPTVDWWKEIQQGIEEADIFLFLISPDSIKSTVCLQEIDHAAKNGKRLIPLVARDITAKEAPSKLANLNWIFFRQSDNFDAALEKLLIAIRTDYQWVQIHRRLQVRALEWERNNSEASYLLRGKDLQEAEAQISANIAKDPNPTELQTQYIHTSRQAETRRQRNLLSGVGIALVVSLGLGLLAFINGQNATNNANNFATQVVIAQTEASFRATEQARAEEQTRIALSRSLATGSRLNFDKQYDLSLLMAVEALNLNDSIEAKAALFDSLEHVPGVLKYIDLGIQSSYSDYVDRLGAMIDYSPDGRYLAARSTGPEVFIVDLESTSPQPVKLEGHQANVIALQFNATKDQLYSLDEEGLFITWDMQTLEQTSQLQIPMVFDQGLLGGTKPLAAISKSGEYVAIINYDETNIWNVNTNSLAQTILPDQILGAMPFTVVTFSPDSRWFAAGAFYKAFAWEVGSGNPVPNADINTDRPVTALGFSPDGQFFVAGSTDGFVHIKNLESGEESNQPPASYGVDITTGQEITTDITGHKDEISGLVFSPDSQTLISASNDQTFIAWDTGHWPVMGPMGVHHAPLIGVSFNPKNGELASMDVNGIVILWDLSKSSRLFEFTDNDQFPLEQSSGKELTPEECANLVNRPESSCVVSPDEKFFISLNPQETYGAYLNTRTPDSLVQLWDFGSKQLIGQFVASAFQPESFVFSADYKFLRILGTSGDFPFLLINLDVPSWSSMACAIANRNFTEGEWGRYMAGTDYRATCQ